MQAKLDLTPNLCAVVVHFGEIAKTKACIDTLLACNPDPWTIQVVVIDNSAHGELNENFLTHFPTGVNLIKLDVNRGYAAALNVGWRWAQSIGANFCLFMNNDLQIFPNAFENLWQAVQCAPNAGIWSGALVYQQPQSKIWFAGGRIQPLYCRTNHYHSLKNREGDFVSGALMLVHKDVLLKTRGFRTDYFLYFEDADFCLRAKIAGFKPKIHDSVLAKHEVGALKNGQYTTDYLYYQTRNRRYFFVQFGGRLYRVYFQIINLVFYVLVRSAFILLQRNSKETGASLQAIFTGYWHSLKNIKYARPAEQ